MKAMIYRRAGGPDVIAAEDTEIPKPGAGEVLVRMAVSGVNPTDWKTRQGNGAEEAGSGHVVNYRRQDVVAEVRRIAPNGVDVIVEVDAVANTATDTAVLGPHGTVVIYAVAPGDAVTMELWPMMWLRARWQFVMIFGETPEALAAAVEDVQAAVAEGAVRVGDDAGLPLHRFDLAHTGSAHAAVTAGAVGKVLITINENPTTDFPNT